MIHLEPKEVARKIYKRRFCLLSMVILFMTCGGFILYDASRSNLLILVGGGAFICFGATSLTAYTNANHWEMIGARIIKISEEWEDVALRFSRLRYYYPVIEYEYEYAGRKYHSNNVSFDIRNIWVPELDQWGVKTDTSKFYWRNWVSGQIIDVFVDKSNPFNSVVINKLSSKNKSQGIAFIGSGILMCLFWWFLNTLQ